MAEVVQRAQPRRRREVVHRADGTQVKIAKPPRADVLWYPRSNWTTVLARRTHDVELATRLADERWAELGDARPFTTSRVGWWTTWATKSVPPSAAIDYLQRAVLWCDDTDRAASPGIEFRP